MNSSRSKGIWSVMSVVLCRGLKEVPNFADDNHAGWQVLNASPQRMPPLSSDSTAFAQTRGANFPNKSQIAQLRCLTSLVPPVSSLRDARVQRNSLMALKKLRAQATIVTRLSARGSCR
jgi:hypothetical protein